jgi:CBS domain-containing protein
VKKLLIKDLMVPLSEYATVRLGATLFDAVLALEKAQEEFDHTKYRHRGVIVLDHDGKVVGKLGQLDVLQALEPKYREMGEIGQLRRFGFSPKFIKNMKTQYRLLDAPLHDICRKAAKIKVDDFMQTPSEGEYVDHSATLDVAIHQLVLGHHMSLLVTDGAQIIGILRLTDVFGAIFHVMKECELPQPK